MSRALGNNVNVDFTKQTQDELKTEKDRNYWHLNALKTALEQLKSGVDRNVVITDIEQYIKDLGT